jgi:hypothetical protein
MNATRIIYPQFWIQPEVEQIFLAQLSTLKAHYCHGKNIGANQMYSPPLLDELKLEAQASFFKMTISQFSDFCTLVQLLMFVVLVCF